MTKIFFVRRQAPDWHTLSEDYRNGKLIDPKRFVPAEDIPGFPANIVKLIDRWNSAYSVDFFTFRAVVSSLSRKNISGIEHSMSLTYDDPQLFELLRAHDDALVYFHDDDDFFSPDIAKVVFHTDWDGDVIVSPLFRIGADTFTFVKPDVGSDYVWGEARDFHLPFQSNNYGMRVTLFEKPDDLIAFKDHVEASEAFLRLKMKAHQITTPISATVKTPASASVLNYILSPKAQLLRRIGLGALRRDLFRGFLSDSDPDGVPAEYDWIKGPVEELQALVQAIVLHKPYEGTY